jgi:hypothetical protein
MEDVMKQKNKKAYIVVVLLLLGEYIFSQTGTDSVQIIDWKGKNFGIKSPSWLEHMILDNYRDFCEQYNLPQNTVVRFEMLGDRDLKVVEKNIEEIFIQSLMFELNRISDSYFSSTFSENNFSYELEVVEKTNSL